MRAHDLILALAELVSTYGEDLEVVARLGQGVERDVESVEMSPCEDVKPTARLQLGCELT